MGIVELVEIFHDMRLAGSNTLAFGPCAKFALRRGSITFSNMRRIAKRNEADGSIIQRVAISRGFELHGDLPSRTLELTSRSEAAPAHQYHYERHQDAWMDETDGRTGNEDFRMFERGEFVFAGGRHRRVGDHFEQVA